MRVSLWDNYTTVEWSTKKLTITFSTNLVTESMAVYFTFLLLLSCEMGAPGKTYL
jgi:hypothetical protein